MAEQEAKSVDAQGALKTVAGPVKSTTTKKASVKASATSGTKQKQGVQGRPGTVWDKADNDPNLRKSLLDDPDGAVNSLK